LKKKVAVLIDGGFARVKLGQAYRRQPTVEEIVRLGKSCLSEEEELFRIYFYDCPPFDKNKNNPISGKKLNFKDTPYFVKCTNFQAELAEHEQVAFRFGQLNHKAWRLKQRALRGLLKSKNGGEIGPDDIEPHFEQKRVDIKIGLDIAWLALKRIVERIVLVTGDSDFIPAMKFARIEGIQIVLVKFDHQVKSEMYIHSDFIRNIAIPDPD